MNALSVLYLVLPLVGVFILHEAEELATASIWARNRHQRNLEASPQLKLFLGRLYGADKKELWVTAVEQLVVLAVITGYLLVGGSKSELVWIAAFLAYSVHSLLHIVRSLLVKGYFPGLVTAVLSLPFAAYGVYSISLAYPFTQIVSLALIGLSLSALNLMIVKYLLMTHKPANK